MKKLLAIIVLGLLFSGNVYAKMFNSITGVSFSLTDDWTLSSEGSTEKLIDKSSIKNKKFMQSILKKSKVSKFEVLYNDKYVPDVITITKQKLPNSVYIDQKNVKSHCDAILKINAKAIGKKGTLYDCKLVNNKLGYKGALFMSQKDDISQEKLDVKVNQIILITNSEGIYFATSCSKYCKEVTGNIYAINSSLKLTSK